MCETPAAEGSVVPLLALLGRVENECDFCCLYGSRIPEVFLKWSTEVVGLAVFAMAHRSCLSVD